MHSTTANATVHHDGTSNTTALDVTSIHLFALQRMSCWIAPQQQQSVRTGGKLPTPQLSPDKFWAKYVLPSCAMFRRALASTLAALAKPQAVRCLATARPTFPSVKMLESIGLPGGDKHDFPESKERFPDGGQYRIEIPSTEGYASLKVNPWQLRVWRVVACC